MSRARLTLFLLLVPALMASRCKKNPDEEVDVVVDANIGIPEVKLQVVSIDPAWGEALIPFKATLYGADFQDGATVSFGTVQAAKVTWRDSNTLLVYVPPLNEGAWDVTVRNPDGTSATLRRGLTVQPGSKLTVTTRCDAATMHFELDSSALMATDRSTLDVLVPCLAERRGAILLEGHCDSRGTTEYNLALGQRRADTVRGYLIGQGISPDRIRVISYGEERPVEMGNTEAAWAANRRVELKADP